jgi:hypothetical protein
LKTNVQILGSRLLTTVTWLAWAHHHLIPNPGKRRAPTTGYVEREQVMAAVERFGISAKIYATPNLWSDLGDVIASTPALQTTNFDLSGLLTRMARNMSDSELHMNGFVRLLQMVAVGELTEAELLPTPPN